MNLIARSYAAKLTTADLHGLYREAFNALAAAPRGTQEFRSALASLEAIEAELARRPAL